MDWTSIITALIAAGASMAGTWAMSAKQKKEDAVKEAVREQAQADRLDRIEKKLDEHNGYAQKFADATTAIALLQKDVEYIKEKGVK